MSTTAEPTFHSLDAGEEADLIARTRMGNREAFLELVRQSQRPLYRVLVALCRDEKRAAAHTTETLVLAAEKMHAFPTGRRFLPWVVGIARTLPAPDGLDWSGAEKLEELIASAPWSDPGAAVFEKIERDVEEMTRPGAHVSPARAGAAGAGVAGYDLTSFATPGVGAKGAVRREAGTARARSPFPWGVVTLVVLAGSGAFAVGMTLVPRWLGAGDASGRAAVPAAAAVVEPSPGVAPADGAAAADGGWAAESTSIVGEDPAPVPEPVPAPAPGAASEPATPAPATPAPVLRTAVVEVTPEAATPPPPARPKPVKAAPPVVVDFGAPQAVNAAGLQDPGSRAHASASELETAAEGWERVLDMLQGAEYRDACHRIAESRYQAWRLEPNSLRAAMAAEAIRQYLAVAPNGGDREKARQWLGDVEGAQGR